MLLKSSQDTFIVGKSIFRQCISPKCFYSAYREHNWCRKHMVESRDDSGIREKERKALDA